MRIWKYNHTTTTITITSSDEERGNDDESKQQTNGKRPVFYTTFIPYTDVIDLSPVLECSATVPRTFTATTSRRLPSVYHPTPSRQIGNLAVGFETTL